MLITMKIFDRICVLTRCGFLLLQLFYVPIFVSRGAGNWRVNPVNMLPKHMYYRYTTPRQTTFSLLRFICIVSYMSKEKDNQFRKKRGDTRIGSIEKQYGVDLGARSDMKLSTYLEEKGYSSLSRLVASSKKK